MIFQRVKRIYIQFRIFCLLLLDWLTRKKGISITFNGLKLKIPGRYYRYFTEEYEKDNFLFLKEKVNPGFICIDIGAHIGIYTVYMAKLSNASVFSFEPTPSSMKTLRKMVAINHCEDTVTILPAAVAERTGKTSFYLNNSVVSGSDDARVAEANSLVYVDFGKTINKEKIGVNTVSIDDFAEINNLKIHFIKMDAEGAELDILKGAGKTILAHRPSGIISVHCFAFTDKEQTLADIWQIVSDYKLIPLFHNEEMTELQFLSMSKTDIFDFQFTPRLT